MSPSAGDQPAASSPDPASEPCCTDARWARVLQDDKLATLEKEAAAAWLGFSLWSREIGHDPHQVLRQAPMGSTEIDLPYTILCGQINYLERWGSQLLEDAKNVDAFYRLLTRHFRAIGY
jgi:hypothetical protein